MFSVEQDHEEAEPLEETFPPIFTVGDEVAVEGKPVRQYHIECESSPNDKSIAVRIFEYGFIAGMDGKELTGPHLRVTFPHSGVLYLRSNRETPDALEIEIVTPDGSVTYSVPTLKIKRYTPEELFAKNLLFLIPFYIFNCEGDIAKGEENSDVKEELFEKYKRIILSLDEMANQGKVDSYVKSMINDLTYRVAMKLAQGHDSMQKGLSDIMGGYVVETWADKFIRIGREQGIQQGRNDVLFGSVQDGDMALGRAAKRAGMTQEQFTAKMREAGYSLPADNP